MKVNNVACRLSAEGGQKEMLEFLRQLQSRVHPLIMHARRALYS